MTMTLTQAAEATGRSRSTLLRAIRKGMLSASRDGAGGFLVDESELARVFPPNAHDAPDARQPRLAEVVARLEAAEARIADKDATIADLRARLDASDADRRQTADRLAAAQERIAALLTGPTAAAPGPAAPARRPWWLWRRS